MASNSQYAMPPSVFPARKRKRSVPVTLKAKLKRTISREFRDYWWLFRRLHVSRYGARLVEEERKKKKMNNSALQPFQLCHFKNKVRSPNFGHVWKLCCETLILSSVFNMRLVLTIPSVSFFEHSKFEVISI